jgi:SpoVK/Ycf46/Vps4 family AAA+-type ATPase
MEAKSKNLTKDITYPFLVSESEKFKLLKKHCISAIKSSFSGIVNLVVNFEDPCLVDYFLKNCFKTQELYRETFDIDAVALQRGAPGQGFASKYIDELIFGTYEREEDRDGLGNAPLKVDAQTGKIKRNPDGFVNRKEVLTNDKKFKDKLLIIKNIDFSLDFCQEVYGKIDARSLGTFDNFRDPSIRLGCRILLITNKPLQFPFKIRTVKLDPVDEFDANYLINSFINFSKNSQNKENSFSFTLNSSQKDQVIRKLYGLTYTEAGDSLVQSLSESKEEKNGKSSINVLKLIKKLREKVNASLMQDAVGLSHLTPRPWEDYICPESSSFTYDVKKIVRDFQEIEELKVLREENIKKEKDDADLVKNSDAIRSRMPHVIVLYGKGGVGKSCFPIHFAGLLDFDVWDFNVNASHSKWIGEGSEKMRQALTKISKATHLVLRIDEYDRAMGSTGASGEGMHEAHKQVESEFMNWLQNCQEENLFVKNDIFIILTTNHKENITGPLLRSGRSDLVIDINDFDEKSMRETFLSAPRRMKNRGALVVGFDDTEELFKNIEKLDVAKIAQIASQKGFTVRDVDTLLQEMAAHDYYCKKNKMGIPWCTESFIKVLENSEGSMKGNDTSELILGDRFLLEVEKNANPQTCFDFYKDSIKKFDPQEFINNIHFD